MELLSSIPAFLQENCYSLLLVLLLVIVTSRWFFRKPSDLPPGPFSLPVIGCLHLIGPLPHVSLHELSRKYGGIMHLKFGTVPFVVVSSEEAAKELYKYRGLEFASKVPTIAGRHFGNDFNGIVYAEYTPQLKLYRKIVNTHLLSATRLKVYDKIRREEQCSLARSIVSAEGTPIKLRDKFHNLNVNIITYMLFGERFYGAHARNTAALDAFVDAVIESLRLSGVFNISDFIPAIKWLDVQRLEKRYKQLIAKVNDYLLSVLQDHRRNPRKYRSDEPVPFIDVLLSLDSTEEEVSDITKLSLLFDMLLGAVDTSALSLEWAITELLRHPAVMEKARKDIDSVVGSNRLVEDSDLDQLPFIAAIAKETLRLHQLAPLALPKVVRGGPSKLGGYTIPNGTCTFVNFHSLGIDPAHWKDPMKYWPERFLEADIDVFGQDYNLLPFGSGRRRCPGAKLGFDMLQIGIATLVQGFEWKLAKGRDPAEINMNETYGLVCHKTQPLIAVPKARLEGSIYSS
ncbi:hypothetical protein SELMODRAFT_448922 [Selaginella moellendorffii]|uniref:Cytochrome P450-dependent monooxygenase n=1 Tax=Selaginella moellendorffii TaxID=88036 RepID=D8TB69_SELML|nr:flavonoid 3'-monooxygenase [Selaginella moellendorffii]EFJ06131.1 hypothetical protein SELMODRAFT_448922 [Selaginella moellendorffii]|eukprot:XP_002992841.1 flavonoid 3'-monooxygenase [Selaginella moellendorffii]